MTNEDEEKSIKRAKIIFAGLGSILVIIGIIRQWPIYGKTYTQFIEGEGYLALMVGLVTIILGLSIRLFTGEYYTNLPPGQDQGEKKKK